MRNKYKILIFLVALIAAFFIIILITNKIAKDSISKSNPEVAQATSVLPRPFGGPIIKTIACNTGFLITVGPPVIGTFRIVPGTIIFPYRSFRIGAYVLGATLGGTSPCYQGYSKRGEGEIVTIIGTSF